MTQGDWREWAECLAAELASKNESALLPEHIASTPDGVLTLLVELLAYGRARGES